MRVMQPLFAEFSDDLNQLGKLYSEASLYVYAIEVPIYFFFLFYSDFTVNLLPRATVGIGHSTAVFHEPYSHYSTLLNLWL